MKGIKNQFSMKSRHEVIFTSKEFKEMKDEIPCSIQENCEQIHTTIIKSKVPNEVDEYYQHSKYVIDPCKFKLSKVLRILSLIKRFIKILREKTSGKAHATSEEQFNTSKQLTVTEEEIRQAQEYFFQESKSRNKTFFKETTYKNITEERNGILYYTGRILPTSAITAAGKITATMLDSSATSFCVPATSHHSPIAYSIANEVHWHEEVKHSGIETTLRYVLKKTYIIHGRELVKKIKRIAKDADTCLKRPLMSLWVQYQITT